MFYLLHGSESKISQLLMNWGVLWYIDFADWKVISPCIEAIQTCIIFLVGTRSFTLYVLVQFYGKSEFCENGGFSLSGSHMYMVWCASPWLNAWHTTKHLGVWFQQNFCNACLLEVNPCTEVNCCIVGVVWVA